MRSLTLQEPLPKPVPPVWVGVLSSELCGCCPSPLHPTPLPSEAGLCLHFLVFVSPLWESDCPFRLSFSQLPTRPVCVADLGLRLGFLGCAEFQRLALLVSVYHLMFVFLFPRLQLKCL